MDGLRTKSGRKGEALQLSDRGSLHSLFFFFFFSRAKVRAGRKGYMRKA